MIEFLKRLFRKTKTKKREWYLWIGDGMAAATPELIGCKFTDVDGHEKTIVDTTQLKVLLEWEE